MNRCTELIPIGSEMSPDSNACAEQSLSELVESWRKSASSIDMPGNFLYRALPEGMASAQLRHERITSLHLGKEVKFIDALSGDETGSVPTLFDVMCASVNIMRQHPRHFSAIGMLWGTAFADNAPREWFQQHENEVLRTLADPLQGIVYERYCHDRNYANNLLPAGPLGEDFLLGFMNNDDVNKEITRDILGTLSGMPLSQDGRKEVMDSCERLIAILVKDGDITDKLECDIVNKISDITCRLQDGNDIFHATPYHYNREIQLLEAVVKNMPDSVDSAAIESMRSELLILQAMVQRISANRIDYGTTLNLGKLQVEMPIASYQLGKQDPRRPFAEAYERAFSIGQDAEEFHRQLIALSDKQNDYREYVVDRLTRTFDALRDPRAIADCLLSDNPLDISALSWMYSVIPEDIKGLSLPHDLESKLTPIRNELGRMGGGASGIVLSLNIAESILRQQYGDDLSSTLLNHALATIYDRLARNSSQPLGRQLAELFLALNKRNDIIGLDLSVEDLLQACG